MRRSMVFLVLGLSLLPAPALPEPPTPSEPLPLWEVDPDHSEVRFSIRHFLTPVSGRFNKFAGEIRIDPDRLDRSSVVFTVQADSIDTNNAERDRHLRSADFFDVARYPTLHFHSRRFLSRGSTLEVTGDLTLHGVTREITVPVEFLGTLETPEGPKAGFASTFKINRKDFGITWNQNLDQGGAVLGEEVTIRISVQAQQAQPPSG